MRRFEFEPQVRRETTRVAGIALKRRCGPPAASGSMPSVDHLGIPPIARGQRGMHVRRKRARQSHRMLVECSGRQHLRRQETIVVRPVHDAPGVRSLGEVHQVQAVVVAETDFRNQQVRQQLEPRFGA